MTDQSNPPNDLMTDTQRVAMAIFRATFADDEDEALVLQKWSEWDESRRLVERQARYAIQAMSVSSSDVRREALEEAAQIVDDWPFTEHERGNDLGDYIASKFEDCAQAIRALSSHTLEKRGGEG